MKNKCFFFLFILILVGTGCSKFLDREPISSAVEETFYRNTAEVEAGVLGCYSSLRDVYNIDPIMAGLRSDDCYVSESEGDVNLIDGFGEATTNSYITLYWQYAYFTIKQCNTILKYLDNVDEPAKRDYFEGEAKFLRAHMYFNLVRLYGDVPLITTNIAYNDAGYYRKVSKDTVYMQIISDFTTAMQRLPSSWTLTQVGRVTNNAAKGMLAKVYLTLQNYPASRALLLDLIQNPGPNQLLLNYKSVFGISNEMNAEIMYAVRYKSNSNGLGNVFTYNMDKLPGSPSYKAASDFRGNTPFPNADSIRKSQTFLNGGPIYGSSYYVGGKYQDPGSLKYDGGADFIVLRYADVILMYAEVVNEMDGDTPLTATDETDPLSRLYQLNRIRARAAGPVPAAVPVCTFGSSSVNSKDNFRKTLKAERRRELGVESHRWFDLIRWGDAITVMNAHFASRNLTTVVEPYQLLYPIPQREIDVTNGILKQNPGY